MRGGAGRPYGHGATAHRSSRAQGRAARRRSGRAERIAATGCRRKPSPPGLPRRAVASLALGTGRFLGAGSFAPNDATARRGNPGGDGFRRHPVAAIRSALPDRRRAARPCAREERCAVAPCPYGRPAPPRIGGAGGARSLHSRSRVVGAALGLDPPALARAARPRGRNRCVRCGVRPCPVRPARGCCSSRRRDEQGAWEDPSLLRARIGPGRRIRGFLMVRSLRSS